MNAMPISTASSQAPRKGLGAPQGEMVSSRPSWWQRVLKLALGLGLVGGLGYGGWELRKYALTDARFALVEIDVEGSLKAKPHEVLGLSQLKEGQNIFSFDAQEVQNRVLAHPWIAHAELTRIYPNKVSLKIVEHEPCLLVAIGALYFADSNGRLVKRYSQGEQTTYPVVTGLTRRQVEEQGENTRRQLQEVISFIEVSKRFLSDENRVVEVHLGAPEGLSFLTASDDATVVIGSHPWQRKLTRFLQVQEALRQRGVKAARIMLAGERRADRVVARLASAQEPSDIK